MTHQVENTVKQFTLSAIKYERYYVMFWDAFLQKRGPIREERGMVPIYKCIEFSSHMPVSSLMSLVPCENESFANRM